MTDLRAEGARPERLPVTGLLLLAGLALFWGANWPGMKIALAELPVWWFRAMCLWAGAAGLLTIAAASGTSLRLPAAQLPQLILVSFFAIFCWHVCAAYGVSLMPAGRASIIAFTMPVWAAILSTFVLGERMTVYKVACLALGTRLGRQPHACTRRSCIHAWAHATPIAGHHAVSHPHVCMHAC